MLNPPSLEISRTFAETCVGWVIPHWFLVSFQFVAAYILSNSHVRQLNPRLFPSVSPQESQVPLLKPPFLSIFLVEPQLFSISKRPRCSASSCHRCWGCHHSGVPVGWGRVSAHCLRNSAEFRCMGETIIISRFLWNQLSGFMNQVSVRNNQVSYETSIPSNNQVFNQLSIIRFYENTNNTKWPNNIKNLVKY